MSEPVSNVEIEDVLSSIRRLVTESGSKPNAQDAPMGEALLEVEDSVEPIEMNQPQPAEDEPADDENDVLEKLVLTPSLRIAETVVEDVPREEVIAEETPTEEETAGVTTDFSDDSIGVDAESTPDDSPVPTDQAAESLADEDLKERIELLETAVASQDDDWEDDGDGEGDNAATPFEALQWEDHSDAHDDAFDTEDKSEAMAMGEAEMFIAPQPKAEPEVSASEAEDVAAEGFELSAEDAVIDEDMLREMVADIVRQELQGALGERITRNVRKLVRREIHRALMAQELE